MTFKGLLNTISNGNGTRAGRLECITPPSYRFAKTTDEVENFLYLMIYCNLLGAFKNNKSVVQAYKASVDANANFDATQKERIKAIVGMMFEGKFAEAEPTLSNISQEIISNVPNNLKNMLLGFFGRFLDGFYSFFDKIYQAIKKFL